MGTLTFAPNVLQWAASNVGATVEQLAPRVAAPSKVKQLVEGRMTAKQAEAYAKLTRVPFGTLFLEQPPAVVKPGLPDLRQVQNAEPLSSAFFDTLSDLLNKQEWYADHLEEIEARPPECVGKFKLGHVQVSEVARDIAMSIGCNAQLRAQCANKEEYFSALVRGVEKAGVLVFKSGVVHNNGHRPLNVAEFRGFAIAHPLAPVVFVNGKDAAAAWIFTLLHEVAHIWLGASGVSSVSATNSDAEPGLEQLCNKVAAEVLTPAEEFRTEWGTAAAPQIPAIAKVFKVSRLVVARRALDLGLIPRDEYLEVLRQTRAAEAREDREGGDYYRSLVVRNSRKLTNAVLSEAFAGRMLLRDAGSLLNASPSTVVGLHNRKELR